MKRIKLLEFIEHKNQCPEGDWKPTVRYQPPHPDRPPSVDMISIWPNPYLGQGIYMPGTWVADLGCTIIILPGNELITEREDKGDMRVVTAYLLTPDDFK